MQLGKAGEAGAKFMTTLATILDRNAKLSKQVGDYQQRQDKWNEQASEAQTEIQRLQFEQTAAALRFRLPSSSKPTIRRRSTICSSRSTFDQQVHQFRPLRLDGQ